MWKYLTKEDQIKFLLSLHLIDNKSPLNTLYSISNNIVNNYNIYKIKKNNGGYRTIYEPKPCLKHIQKQILHNILDNKSISKYATAYHKNLSLKDNTIPHVNKHRILKLDIKHFFDNIDFYKVLTCCFPIEYFPESIGILLTILCTYDGFVPQGSPTAAYISNLILKDFDNEIGYWCEEQKINYTRYSDDMTFSGNFNPSVVIKKVRKLLQFMNFELNDKKTCVVNNSQKQRVTGVVINNKINIDIEYRKKIRQEVYYIKKYGIDNHMKRINSIIPKKKYINQLIGKINYIIQINNCKEFSGYLKYLKRLTIS